MAGKARATPPPPPTVAAVVLVSLAAQARDVPVEVKTVGGGYYGPERIVWRETKDVRDVNGCRVEVRLEGGTVLHLGEVTAMRVAP